MSETFVNPIFGVREELETVAEVEGTGNADVDAVVASLTALDEQPVAGHVAVFEQAHESLRRTLAGAANNPSISTDDSAAGRS